MTISVRMKCNNKIGHKITIIAVYTVIFALSRSTFHR